MKIRILIASGIDSHYVVYNVLCVLLLTTTILYIDKIMVYVNKNNIVVVR